MAAVHEVIGRDGICLYRGTDIELACELYAATAPGTRLRSRSVWLATDEPPQDSAADEPGPYSLTRPGQTSTSHCPSVPADQPVPYALAARSAHLFVVDTANVADLRRRCPELFTWDTRSDEMNDRMATR